MKDNSKKGETNNLYRKKKAQPETNKLSSTAKQKLFYRNHRNLGKI